MEITEALQPQPGPLDQPMVYPNLQKGMGELIDRLRADLVEQTVAKTVLRQRMAAAFVQQTCSELQLLATTNLLVQIRGYGGDDLDIERANTQGDFIQISNELYGDPEEIEPDWLAAHMIAEFNGPNYLGNVQVDQQALERILRAYAIEPDKSGGDPRWWCMREVEPSTLVTVKDYLDRMYGAVLAVFAIAPGPLTLVQLDDLLSAAHRQLRLTDRRWTDPNLSLLDQALVGLAPGQDRHLLASLGADKIRILYIRAVLQILRLMNAQKYNDPWLERGLPGSHNAGRGLDILVECALTGYVPDYAIDLCIDSAWLLGMLGPQSVRPQRRSQIFQVMLDKLLVRAQSRGEMLDPAVQHVVALEHTNTLFMGTEGDGDGVFTRGSAYLGSFVATAIFLRGDLEDGRSIDEIMDYLLTGLFEPLYPLHCDYVDQVRTGGASAD
ncbi:MAG TPA: hypothetical protein VNG90_00195 [Candidatus Acidoferrum sp.]|nr:hypothetical protein [Candidatus Acidoferrum sp.]